MENENQYENKDSFENEFKERKTLDEDKLAKEIDKFFGKSKRIPYFWAMIGTLVLTIPQLGITVWMIYWSYKVFQHFSGKDLTKTEKVVVEE